MFFFYSCLMQFTFVVSTGVCQIHKLFNVTHLLWDVDQQLHRVVLAVFEVQQGLHQHGFSVGQICNGTYYHSDKVLGAGVALWVSHSHKEWERDFMFWCRYWCRLASFPTSLLATASNNLSMLYELLSLLFFSSPRIPLETTNIDYGLQCGSTNSVTNIIQHLQ